jgi:hypothetical protein
VVASNLIFVHSLWNVQIFNILKSFFLSLHFWHDSIFPFLVTYHFALFWTSPVCIMFACVCVCFIATLFVRCLYSIFYFSWYKNLYIILISFSECSFVRNFAKNLLSQRRNSVVITKEICCIKKFVCKSDIFEWTMAVWYCIVTLSCWHMKISFFFFPPWNYFIILFTHQQMHYLLNLERFKIYTNIAPTYFGLRPSSRELVLSLVKVILKHSVKLCPYRLCGGVAACLGVACVLCA